MKYALATVATIALLTAVSTSAHASNRRVEGALQSSGDVSLFYQALLRTGVADELNESTTYTVFAPINTAFVQELPRATFCYSYSAPCREQMAMVVRNHIVPSSQSIRYLSRIGAVPTIGLHRLFVEEDYKNAYKAGGFRVLNRSDGDTVRIYRIDGIIATDQQMAQLRSPQVVEVPATVTQRTVTTYTRPYTTTTVVPSPAPSGHLTSRTVTVTQPNPTWTDPDDLLPDDTTTTTVTRTTTSQSTP